MLNKDHFNKWLNKNYEITSNNKIKVIGKQRFLTETDIYANYVKACEYSCLETNFTSTDIKNELVSKYTNQQNAAQQKTCREWILDYIKGNKHWKFNSAMTEIEYDATDKGIYMSSGIDDMNDRLLELNGNTGKPYDVGIIKAVLNNIAKDAVSNYLAKVYEQIKYDKTYEQKSDEFLKGIYDYLQPTESFDIFKVLMKHWAWQVKRKILGKNVRNHIWINFYGGTGLGKTTMIQKMCGVMDEFLSTTSIAKLFDDTKEIKRLTEKYILNFDELAINGNEPGDGFIASDQLAILKQMLTGKYLDTRIYGTQQQSRRKITFTCISSANYHLYDTIFDEQSMRRFFEFHCQALKPQNYDQINTVLIHSIDFWKGINEIDDMGYWIETDEEMWKTIESIQKNYFPTKTTVSQWISFNKLTDGDKTAKEIYPVYKLWCDENGFRNKKSLPAFIEEMKRRFPQYIDPSDGIMRFDLEKKDNELLTKKNTIIDKSINDAAVSVSKAKSKKIDEKTKKIIEEEMDDFIKEMEND